MNLCLFFEGTGRGVAGKITNVTRLRDLCVDDAWQFRRGLCGGSEAVERMLKAGEPTVAREHVCGPGVILTTA